MTISESSPALRTAIIGVGHIGRHHARILASLPGSQLVGVVDANYQQAHAMAEQYQTKAFRQPTDLIGKADAVVIAVPTIYHQQTAAPLIEAGIACMIEKPIASTMQEAKHLTRLADKHHTIVQVGHIERFNPCWKMAEASKIKPTYIHAERKSPYPFRSIDVSVVFDVMIHDLDLVQSIVGSPINHVDAAGRRVLSPTWDEVDAWLTFENGCRAYVAASRIHHEAVRRIRLNDHTSLLELDLLTKRAQLNARTQTNFRLADVPTDMEARKAMFQSLILQESTSVPAGDESLKVELSAFLDHVRTGSKPACDARAASEALLLAELIEAKLAEQVNRQPRLAA